jgi:competence ComEA-like helix-hairpin-helix protein
MQPRYPGEPLLPTRRHEQAVLIGLGALAALLAAVILLRRSAHESAPFEASDQGAPPHFQININTADATELQLLPGVGASLAARIVHSRELDGPFASVLALERVTGFGQELIDQLRPLVRTDPDPDLPDPLK